jgi:hypothetical protein
VNDIFRPLEWRDLPDAYIVGFGRDEEVEVEVKLPKDGDINIKGWISSSLPAMEQIEKFPNNLYKLAADYVDQELKRREGR